MLEEAKIVLDWADAKLQKAIKLKSEKQENFNEALKFYTKLKNKFDELCIQWIENNCN